MNTIIQKSLILLGVSTLLLVQACDSGGGSGGGGSGGGGETKSDKAEIVKLVIKFGGSDETVDFGTGTNVTLTYPDTTLDYVSIRKIELSTGASATAATADDSTTDTVNYATMDVINGEIAIVVTAENGSTSKTYTIRFTSVDDGSGGGGETKSDKAEIVKLVIKFGGSDETVDFGTGTNVTLTYLGDTAPDYVSIRKIELSTGASATAATADDSTTDAVNYATMDVINGEIAIVVTAENGSTKDYTISFIQRANTQADITDLTITLMGDGYTEDREVTFINREATVDYQYGAALNFVIIKSIGLSYGAESDLSKGSAVSVTVGKSTGEFTIVVTAQDVGISKSYTIRFTEAANTQADITGLTITLMGDGYTEDREVTFINREATVDYPYAKKPDSVMIESIGLSYGAESDPSQGGSTVSVTSGGIITIDVTSEDSSTINRYTIRFRQLTNTQANINSLTITLTNGDYSSDHTVEFTEGSSTISYPYSLGGNPADLTIRVTDISISDNAKATQGDNDVSVDTGAVLNLTDSDTVSILVTAENTDYTSDYTIRFGKNSEANIEHLVITLIGDNDYTADREVTFINGEATVEYPYGEILDSISIKSIEVSAGATYGDPSSIENGESTITVTAENGSTSKTYTIRFSQAANTQANIDSLAITLTNGDFSSDHPVDFTADTPTIIYPFSLGDPAGLTISVKDISISDKAEASQGGIKVLVGSSLTDGSNDTVTIRVTAENTDYSNDYSFILQRSTTPNTEAEIKELTLSVGEFEQSVIFAADKTATLQYLVGSSFPLPVSIVSIELPIGARATAPSGPQGDILDFYLSGYSVQVPQSASLTITVTSEDSSTDQTYRITFFETERPGLSSVISSSQGGDDNGLGWVPSKLSFYDELTQIVLAPYTSRANVHAIYITMGGGTSSLQGGTSWSDAAPGRELKNKLDALRVNASADDIYLFLIASSGDASYDAVAALTMQNHVAIVGGWDASGGWDRSGTTVLSGGGSHRVINNDYTADNPLTNTALLYGVSLEDGLVGRGNGGGILNSYASPILTNVTIANNSGGGITNESSSPVLTNVTIANNSSGGGITNESSSPVLTNVTIANNSGSGIYNNNSSSPVLTNVTIANNSSGIGGGILNSNSSSPVLINVTIANNIGLLLGGGIYNLGGSPVIVNSIFWGNTAYDGGPQIYVQGGTVTLAYSLLEGGVDTIDKFSSSTLITAGISIVDPVLGDLTTDAGSLVATMAIGQDSSSDSSAKDFGIYVRRHIDPSGDTYYYSEDGSKWYIDFTSDTDTSTGGFTGDPISTAALPEGSIDLTATDATGKARENRPDAGAYEYISEAAAP